MGAIPRKQIVWTVGHSTRTVEVFIEILNLFQVQLLVDVRSYPGSRRHPQFGKDNLGAALAAAEIGYLHFPILGGRRRARPDSRNIAWRNEGFRGYADYMETNEFQGGLEELLEMAKSRRVVIMCAEALWWRCHRTLISDKLKALEVDVVHIIDAKKSEPHRFTPAANIVDGKLSYHGLLGE